MPLAKKVAAEFVGTFILILMFAVVSKLGSFIHSFTGQLGVEARQTYGEGLEGRQRVPVVHGEHAPLDLAELQDHRVIVRRRRQRRWGPEACGCVFAGAISWKFLTEDTVTRPRKLRHQDCVELVASPFPTRHLLVADFPRPPRPRRTGSCPGPWSCPRWRTWRKRKLRCCGRTRRTASGGALSVASTVVADAQHGGAEGLVGVAAAAVRGW
jgi:hypothetical protein